MKTIEELVATQLKFDEPSLYEELPCIVCKKTTKPCMFWSDGDDYDPATLDKVSTLVFIADEIAKRLSKPSLYREYDYCSATCFLAFIEEHKAEITFKLVERLC